LETIAGRARALPLAIVKSANLQLRFTTAIYKLRSTTGQMLAVVVI
jgi:hypothetical protein